MVNTPRSPADKNTRETQVNRCAEPDKSARVKRIRAVVRLEKRANSVMGGSYTGVDYRIRIGGQVSLPVGLQDA